MKFSYATVIAVLIATAAPAASAESFEAPAGESPWGFKWTCSRVAELIAIEWERSGDSSDLKMASKFYREWCLSTVDSTQSSRSSAG